MASVPAAYVRILVGLALCRRYAGSAKIDFFVKNLVACTPDYNFYRIIKTDCRFSQNKRQSAGF